MRVRAIDGCILVRCEGVWMYLAADGSGLVIACPHLIQAQHLARRVVQLVMVDLDMRERSIELHINITLPGGESHVRHNEVGVAVYRRGNPMTQVATKRRRKYR